MPLKLKLVMDSFKEVFTGHPILIIPINIVLNSKMIKNSLRTLIKPKEKKK